MNNYDNDILMIDQFLRGELSKDEITNFRLRLTEDENFNKEYKLRLTLQASLKRSALSEKHEMIKEIEDNEFSVTILSSTNVSSKIIPFRKKLIYALSSAAAIALVATLIFPWWNADGPYDHLFSSQFEAYPSSVIKRGTQSDLAKTKEIAYVLYEIGEYEKAAPYLEKLAVEGDTESNLYAGIAYLGLKQHNKSLEFLGHFKNYTDKNTDVADLYIAINNLMLGNKKDALKELERLSSNNGFIGTKAKAFLKEIENK